MDLLIKATDIHVEHAGRDILHISNLELYAHDRIGLVGANGAGKSTLLQVLLGETQPAGCKIQRLGEIAYIKQIDDIDVNAVGDLGVLSRMGLSGINTDNMSGGEETRAKIAQAFSDGVHAIFADEPTSHLDRGGIDLLVGQIKAFDGAIMTVSHDRYFLDQVVNKIWELKDGRITEYWGNYSQYRQQKDEEAQRQQDLYDQAQLERGRLQRSAEEIRKQSDSKKKQKGVKAFTPNEGGKGHAKSPGTKQKRASVASQNLERRAEALSEIAPPERLRTINFRQSSTLMLHNKFPVTGEGISLSFGERVIFDHANFTIPLGAKVAFIGDNGTGKTTMLKMIANRHDNLTISPKAEFGYFEQTGYKFTTNQSVIAFMEENSDYNQSEIRAVLASVGFTSQDIKKSLRVLSGGEIIKLLMSKMLLGRYNILLLDEPSNYLDIGSLEALGGMMKAYAGTIIFVTHDKRLVENVADLTYEFANGKITEMI
ncbi:MAG: ABC-F type ribosomal protection protein [Defluviitaleaceae bacterium]|nr:ABC-F type ribosomal protection protein [Defluviitaleaceae bacterium]